MRRNKTQDIIGTGGVGRAARKAGEPRPAFMGEIGIDEAGRPQSGRTSPHYHKYVIGIDEAGRGPLAGPIVVAGIRIKPRLARILLRGIRDSKKLSAKKREEWFLRLTAHPGVAWAVSRIRPATIDRINISRAGLRGALLVHRQLSLRASTHVLLDGGLFLPDGISQETIVKGDEKIPVIAAASIIAKVTRDRIMTRLHKKYPQYRFDLHKGYGTVLHRALIGRFGRSPVHRVSFRVR